MNELPNYYAIIPANIRYDKELTPNAKLLYGEITALSSLSGECWAKNKYFAEIYSVSTVSISKWVNQLKGKNYIFIRYEYKKGTKEIDNRCIRIVNDPHKEKLTPPLKEMFKDNSTRDINNTSINNKEKNNKKEHFSKPSIEEIKKYSEERESSVDAELFYNYYEAKGWVIGKSSMKNWRAAFATWERNAKKFQREQPFDYEALTEQEKEIWIKFFTEKGRDPKSKKELIVWGKS